jgi:hypothetical protein
MKHLKMLGLLAVTAALAAVFAGSASATVICKNNLNTSVCSEPYPVGTEGTASLKAGTSMKLTDTSGNTLDTCTGSTIKSTLEKAGSATSTVKSGVSTMTFSGCTVTTDTVNGGYGELHHIAGTDNGSLTTFNTQVTVNVFSSCVYGPSNGANIGTTVGGNPGHLTLNMVAIKISGGFLCPETTRVTGEYVATSPTNAWVSAG